MRCNTRSYVESTARRSPAWRRASPQSSRAHLVADWSSPARQTIRRLPLRRRAVVRAAAPERDPRRESAARGRRCGTADDRARDADHVRRSGRGAELSVPRQRRRAAGPRLQESLRTAGRVAREPPGSSHRHRRMPGPRGPAGCAERFLRAQHSGGSVVRGVDGAGESTRALQVAGEWPTRRNAGRISTAGARIRVVRVRAGWRTG
jgi:hypothetical protein